jgi:hypothetical protein
MPCPRGRGDSRRRRQCDGAVRKRDALVAGTASPFIGILEQVLVDSPEVIGVEFALWTVSGLDFDLARGDPAPFATFESGEVGFTKPVFDGVSARICVVGHALSNVRESFEPRDNLDRFDLAADIGVEDGIAFGVAEYSLDPIVGVGHAHVFHDAARLPPR